MLPTSHPVPMIPPQVELGLELQIEALRDHLPGRGLEWRGSAETSQEGEEQPEKISLAEAFAEFISASARLEASYADLQVEVSELSEQLAERNAALNSSLAENVQIRLALQRIVDFMPCGVLVVDSHGSILNINPETRRLLGLGDGRVDSVDDISVWGRLDLHRYYGPAAEDMEQEFCVPGPTGKRWLELRNRQLSGHHPRTNSREPASHQTILILRDITAQKRMEQERESALRAVTLAEISTILAHEIRNPLAGLELFAGLIAQDGVTNPVWISHMRAGIRSLSGTVNNVLSFHGACPMQLSPVDLALAIEAGIEFVRPIAEQAGVAVRWLGWQGEHPSGKASAGEALGDAASSQDARSLILGSESALQQVVLNLISNAIRHTPEGGSVTVSMKTVRRVNSDVRYVLVQFRDTGCGIPPSLAHTIFEPGVSSGGDTPGLGLTVCRTIIQKHGGAIGVLSQSPQRSAGSTFELEFPLL